MNLFKKETKPPVPKPEKNGVRKQENDDALILLSAGTDFDGEMKASRIIIEGNIKGTVRAEKEIHLKKGALMEGEIHTKNFFAEKGSVYHGELHIDESESEAETNGELVKKIAI